MILEGLSIGKDIYGGMFTFDAKNKINGFESYLELNKKNKASKQEKFDPNLHNIL